MIRNEEKKFKSVVEILTEYASGKRDFRNIVCKGANFRGVRLRGADFSNSDLSFSDFGNADLTECKFINANLQWCDFSFATLRGADFTNASFCYSFFNQTIVEKANFDNVDVKWVLALNTAWQLAKIENVRNRDKMATSLSETTEEGEEEVRRALENLRTQIPFDLWLELKASVERDKTQSIGRNLEETKVASELYIPSTQQAQPSESSFYGFETAYSRRKEKGPYQA